MSNEAATSAEVNNLTITTDRLRGWSACASGYQLFLKTFPQGGEFSVVYAALQADKRFDDSGWLVDHVFAELDGASKAGQTILIAGADAEKIKAAADAGAEAATTGEGAISASLGIESKAKASAGGAIVLAWRDSDGKLLGVFASMVGQNNIKTDAWYSLNEQGQPVEVAA